MSDGNFPDVLLLLIPTDCLLGLQVYGLGFDGGRIIFKKVLGSENGAHFGSGFAVSGTKLFAVGNSWPAKSLKEVKIWDLKDWRNNKRTDNADFPDECGETLGVKPDPVVFEIDGRIYALSGVGCSALDPAFEVFNGEGWKPLPDPPFRKDYRLCPSFKCHTIIGKTLYVALQYYGPELIPLGPWKYFSYDVVADKWDTVTETTKVDDPRAEQFLKHCRMKRITHVADNQMVFLFRPDMEIYACDLNSDLDELAELLPLQRQSKKAKMDGNESLEDDDDYVPPEAVLPDAFRPVRGLESITKDVPKHYSNNQMVAHLAGDIYCLVYFYIQYTEICQKALAIVFEARNQAEEEHCFKATVLDHTILDLIQ